MLDFKKKMKTHIQFITQLKVGSLKDFGSQKPLARQGKKRKTNHQSVRYITINPTSIKMVSEQYKIFMPINSTTQHLN